MNAVGVLVMLVIVYVIVELTYRAIVPGSGKESHHARKVEKS